MMFPICRTFVVIQPVATLSTKESRVSRTIYRRNRYGKQQRFDKLKGKMSPKELRESGL